MNQIKKRLTIIKLAISMTDMETIQLQMLKLTPIKTDADIQKILSLLHAGNYAQAQALISEYIDFAPQEVVQRSDQVSPQNTLFFDTNPEETSSVSEEEQAIIDEFQLIIDSNHSSTPIHETNNVTEIGIDDFAPLKKSTEPEEEDSPINFDSLLNIEAKDVLNNPSDLDRVERDTKTQEEIPQEETPQDTFFDDHRDNIPQEDTFFHTEQEEIMEEEIIEEEALEHEKEATPSVADDISNEILHYSAMPDIAQKFIDLKEKYPPIQKIESPSQSVNNLLDTLSTEAYGEEVIEDILKDIKNLTEEGHYTEAAQLLLICGTTESKYAQFSFARELYRGSLLKKDIPASFTLIQELAIDDYPEALCDLGQFYEHGIGTTPNLAKAEELYKEAVNLGIKRAKKHYTRLHNTNTSFFKK